MAVVDIYRSRFHCLNMVKIQDVNNSYQKIQAQHLSPYLNFKVTWNKPFFLVRPHTKLNSSICWYPVIQTPGLLSLVPSCIATKPYRKQYEDCKQHGKRGECRRGDEGLGRGGRNSCTGVEHVAQRPAYVCMVDLQ